MTAVYRGRKRLMAMMLVFAISLSLLSSIFGADMPSGASSQEIGSDTLFFKLDLPETTLYTGTPGYIRLTVGTTTSVGYGFEFPSDLTITINLPGTKGLLFSESEFSKDGFSYKPTNSRRTLTITSSDSRSLEYFTLDIAVLPTAAGAFSGGQQFIDAGTIKASVASKSKGISLSQSSDELITIISSTDSSGTGSTRGTASGSGTATASIRGGSETLSLKVSNMTGPSTASSGYGVRIEFWSSKNPFTIPKGSTLTLTVPADSPLMFPQSYDGYGAGGDYFIGSLSGPKTLVLTAAKDLSNSEHNITVSLMLDSGKYDPKMTVGGKLTARLELKGVAVTGSWPSVSTPEEIPLGLSANTGSSTWSIVATSEFDPASLSAVVPHDAVDALTGSATYTVTLDAGVGTMPARQIGLTTALILPEGVSVEADRIAVNAAEGEGYHVVSEMKELSDGILIDFVIEINDPGSYELRSVSIPITVDAFMVAWDAFGEQPMVASLATSGYVTPQSGAAYELTEQIAYVKITTPPPYDDEAAFGEEDGLSQLMYQALLFVQPNPFNISGGSSLASFRSIVELTIPKQARTADDKMKEISGELSVGMLRPFDILPGLVEVAVAGLKTK